MQDELFLEIERVASWWLYAHHVDQTLVINITLCHPAVSNLCVETTREQSRLRWHVALMDHGTVLNWKCHDGSHDDGGVRSSWVGKRFGKGLDSEKQCRRDGEGIEDGIGQQGECSYHNSDKVNLALVDEYTEFQIYRLSRCRAGSIPVSRCLDG